MSFDAAVRIIPIVDLYASEKGWEKAGGDIDDYGSLRLDYARGNNFRTVFISRDEIASKDWPQLKLFIQTLIGQLY